MTMKNLNFLSKIATAFFNFQWYLSQHKDL